MPPGFGIEPTDELLTSLSNTAAANSKDILEFAEAIAAVFGPSTPWVSSVKAQTGHEMWMSGASQVVYSLLAAQRGFIPGNRNFEEPDERTACIKVAPEVVRTTPDLILCNAAGFGGTNSCLVVRVGE